MRLPVGVLSRLQKGNTSQLEKKRIGIGQEMFQEAKARTNSDHDWGEKKQKNKKENWCTQ